MKIKKIFLDCGSNIGQGYEYFHSIYGDEYQYYMFEPNPNCVKILREKYDKNKNIKIFDTAVFNQNTEVDFYFPNEDITSVGGSIVDKHNNFYYDVNQIGISKQRVKTINLSEFIDQIYEDGSNIVLKLDIESGEYDVLESLIETKNIFKLSHIYCEFHSQYMDQKTKIDYLNREKNILKYINDNNISFDLWI